MGVRRSSKEGVRHMGKPVGDGLGVVHDFHVSGARAYGDECSERLDHVVIQVACRGKTIRSGGILCRKTHAGRCSYSRDCNFGIEAVMCSLRGMCELLEADGSTVASSQRELVLPQRYRKGISLQPYYRPGWYGVRLEVHSCRSYGRMGRR